MIELNFHSKIVEREPMSQKFKGTIMPLRETYLEIIKDEKAIIAQSSTLQSPLDQDDRILAQKECMTRATSLISDKGIRTEAWGIFFSRHLPSKRFGVTYV